MAGSPVFRDHQDGTRPAGLAPSSRSLDGLWPSRGWHCSEGEKCQVHEKGKVLSL